jgi:hypothetical protein
MIEETRPPSASDEPIPWVYQSIPNPQSNANPIMTQPKDVMNPHEKIKRRVIQIASASEECQ